ncbi:MAG: hypothetical protein CLLPBCKN_000366 [Chroococcidiopsis cubana SAG 39.79]|nr:hypothetical protein [Chroococcidiopsis cubana SAG 39.79]
MFLKFAVSCGGYFGSGFPLLLIFSIGLIGGGDIKRLLSFIITNVAFPNRSAIYNCSIRLEFLVSSMPATAGVVDEPFFQTAP